MTAELRSALIACHNRDGWTGGRPLTGDLYALTLWAGSVRLKRFELSRADYLAAFRVWQWLEHPARRKAYRRKKAA
jgi:hypothetical protein